MMLGDPKTVIAEVLGVACEIKRTPKGVGRRAPGDNGTQVEHR
jgi:hypothetical protein